jgi:hypothetical protein
VPQDAAWPIEAFQSRVLTAADGMIDVGGRTWHELVEVLDGDAQDETSSMEAHGAPEFFFLFDRLPAVNWTGVARSFGSNRSQRWERNSRSRAPSRTPRSLSKVNPSDDLFEPVQSKLDTRGYVVHKERALTRVCLGGQDLF